MKQMRHIRTGIHSVLMFHVGASDIKLAPTFLKSERAHTAAPPFQIAPLR